MNFIFHVEKNFKFYELYIDFMESEILNIYGYFCFIFFHNFENWKQLSFCKSIGFFFLICNLCIILFEVDDEYKTIIFRNIYPHS